VVLTKDQTRTTKPKTKSSSVLHHILICVQKRDNFAIVHCDKTTTILTITTITTYTTYTTYATKNILILFES
jgi:hypothetical protein